MTSFESKVQKFKEIDKLNKEIKKHNNNYYVKNKPTISDEAYDRLVVRLRDLLEEVGHDAIPTVMDKPGSDLTGRLATVKHIRPMISIRTEVDTSEKPINDFMARCEKMLPGKDIVYVAEPKYDGLAISLRYEAGKLKMAVTRGDGEDGEDITHNVIHVPNICHRLPEGTNYEEVRGELVLLKTNFDRANSIRASNGDKPFINCRNAIAGIIRKKEPDVDLLRLTFFIPYSCFGESSKDSQFDNLHDLRMIFHGVGNMYHEPGWRCWGGGLYDKYKNIMEMREELPFEIDGVVYKVDSIKDQEKMGITGREPRWAIAHKLPPQVVGTTLEAIDIQVGPSGRLTPVARLNPVFVGGTTVSNVTLSNIFQIRRKGVRIGDTVLLQRAGDVIPEIIGVHKDNERLHYVPNFRMPKECPVCGGRVMRLKGEANHFCTNSLTCKAQAAGNLERACSRAILDIDGFGPKIAEEMVNAGMTKVSDIFKLTMKDMINLGIGEANGKKLLTNIQQVKVSPMGFDMFLRIIGIPELGASASKKIAAYIGNFNDFIGMTPEELKVTGINQRVIRNIRDFQCNELAIDEAWEIHRQLNIVNYEKNVDGILSGKTIVVTGSAPGISRESLKKKLEELGATMGSSVSKKTDIVIYGEGAGEKLEKATKLGITTKTYEEFMSEYGITV